MPEKARERKLKEKSRQIAKDTVKEIVSEMLEKSVPIIKAS